MAPCLACDGSGWLLDGECDVCCGAGVICDPQEPAPVFVDQGHRDAVERTVRRALFPELGARGCILAAAVRAAPTTKALSRALRGLGASPAATQTALEDAAHLFAGKPHWGTR